MADNVTLPLPQLGSTTVVPSDNLRNPGTAQAEGVATPLTQPTEVSVPSTNEAPQTIQEQSTAVPDNALAGEPIETPCKACKPEKGKMINTDEQGNCVVCGKKPKHAGGRPCMYCQNKEEIQGKTDAFIAKVRATVNTKLTIPFIEELALELNTIDENINNWAKKINDDGEPEHPEFLTAVQTIKMIQKLGLQKRSLGRFNPMGSLKLLEFNHGATTVTKQILAGDKEEPLQIEIIEDKKQIDE